MSTAWVARTAAEYAQAIESELPSGTAWPRDLDSGPMRWVTGSAEIWGDVDARATDLVVTESDPRSTLELLPDWERAFGLPDPCLTAPQTIPDRRAALINRLTIQGAQSRAFFISAATAIGYSISIYEYQPYGCGLSRCGDSRADGGLVITHARCGVAQSGVDRQGDAYLTGTGDWIWQLGAPELRYFWKVRLLNQRVTWLRAGSGIAGQDHFAEISFALDLECMIRRWKPAHTEVVFDYGALDLANDGTLDFSRAGNPAMTLVR